MVSALVKIITIVGSPLDAIEVLTGSEHKRFAEERMGDWDERLFLLVRLLEMMGLYHHAKDLLDGVLKEKQKERSPDILEILVLRAEVSQNLVTPSELMQRIDEIERALPDFGHLLEQEKFAQLTARLKRLRGLALFSRGEIDLALETMISAMAMAEAYYCEELAMQCADNLGSIYQVLGELDTALEYHKRAAEAFEQMGMSLEYARALENMGLVLQGKKDYEKALELFLHSLRLLQNLRNSYYISRVLLHTISLALELGDGKLAWYSFYQLSTLATQNPSPTVSLREKLALAWLREHENRFASFIQAEELYQELLENPHTLFDMKTFAILGLLSLKMKELTLTGNENIITEILMITGQAEQTALENEAYHLVIELLKIKARIALLEHGYVQARDLLSKAREIAEENRLNNVLLQLEVERKELESQIRTLQQLDRTNASINEKLQFLKLGEKFKQIAKQQAWGIPEYPEEPIMIMILSKHGVTLYAKSFTPEASIDPQLVGAFISALNEFSREMFSVRGTIERIEHGEYTMLVNPRDMLLFCYVFKGSAAMAIRRLQKFVSILYMQPLNWEKWSSFMLMVDREEVEIIDKTVDGVFCS